MHAYCKPTSPDHFRVLLHNKPRCNHLHVIHPRRPATRPADGSSHGMLSALPLFLCLEMCFNNHQLIVLFIHDSHSSLHRRSVAFHSSTSSSVLCQHHHNNHIVWIMWLCIVLCVWTCVYIRQFVVWLSSLGCWGSWRRCRGFYSSWLVYLFGFLVCCSGC